MSQNVYVVKCKECEFVGYYSTQGMAEDAMEGHELAKWPWHECRLEVIEQAQGGVEEVWIGLGEEVNGTAP